MPNPQQEQPLSPHQHTATKESAKLEGSSSCTKEPEMPTGTPRAPLSPKNAPEHQKSWQDAPSLGAKISAPAPAPASASAAGEAAVSAPDPTPTPTSIPSPAPHVSGPIISPAIIRADAKADVAQAAINAAYLAEHRAHELSDKETPAVLHAREKVHFKPLDYAHGSVYGTGDEEQRHYSVNGSQVVAAIKTHHRNEEQRQQDLISAISRYQGDLSKIHLPDSHRIELYDHSRVRVNKQETLQNKSHWPESNTTSAEHTKLSDNENYANAAAADAAATAAAAATSSADNLSSAEQGDSGFSRAQNQLSRELSETQISLYSPNLMRAEHQYELNALQHDRTLRSAQQQQLMQENELQAQMRMTRELELPGFGIYQEDSRKIFFDRNAIKLLRLEPSLAQQWLSFAQLSQLLGVDIMQQFKYHLQQLCDSRYDESTAAAAGIGAGAAAAATANAAENKSAAEDSLADTGLIAKLNEYWNAGTWQKQLKHLRQLSDNYPPRGLDLERIRDGGSAELYQSTLKPRASMYLGKFIEPIFTVLPARLESDLSFSPYFYAEHQRLPPYTCEECILNGKELTLPQLSEVFSEKSIVEVSSASSTIAPVHDIALVAAMPLAPKLEVNAYSQINSMSMAATAIVASSQGLNAPCAKTQLLPLVQDSKSRAELLPDLHLKLQGIKASSAMMQGASSPAGVSITGTGSASATSADEAAAINATAAAAYSLALIPYNTRAQVLQLNEETQELSPESWSYHPDDALLPLPLLADLDDIELPFANPSQTGRSRTTFAIYLRLGPHQHEKLYLKLNAFFKADHSLNYVSLTLTRVSSKLFELMPHIVSDSASFDWLLPTDECIYGRNYYTILGYKNNDPRIPYRQRLWQKSIVHPDDLKTLRKEYRVLREDKNGNAFELLYRSRCRDGSYIWTKSVGMVIGRDPDGVASRVLGINIDINRVLEGYEQLQNKVFTDILTGLRNRTYLITHMEQFIASATGPMTIIFADVTALKLYNDYLGHTVGDKLLCSAAILIKSAINRVNELIRISGDEIICILPNCDQAAAALVCHNIIQARQQYNKNAPIRMPVFFSIGSKTIDLRAYAGHKLKDKEKEQALGLFYQAIQDADAMMQDNKRMARLEHYSLVQAYIERSLNHKIQLSDNRLF